MAPDHLQRSGCDLLVRELVLQESFQQIIHRCIRCKWVGQPGGDIDKREELDHTPQPGHQVEVKLQLGAEHQQPDEVYHLRETDLRERT